jgi:hypothetical protein
MLQRYSVQPDWVCSARHRLVPQRILHAAANLANGGASKRAAINTKVAPLGCGQVGGKQATFVRWRMLIDKKTRGNFALFIVSF